MVTIRFGLRVNTRVLVRPVSAILLLLGAVGGCSDRQSAQPASGPTSSPAGVDQILQYSNRWIDNPAVDLMSPEGTFIRAAMESLNRVRYGNGSSMDVIRDAGYPGFVHAFNNVKNPDSVAGNERSDQKQFGTLYWEVVELRRVGNQFAAGVCSYGSMTATQVYDGYRSSGRLLPAGASTWITFGPDRGQSDHDSIAPSPNQRGPLNEPKTSVFGSWVLSEIKVLGTNIDLPQCLNTLAPGTPADAPEAYYVTATPPNALPPSPGWPSV